MSDINENQNLIEVKGDILSSEMEPAIADSEIRAEVSKHATALRSIYDRISNDIRATERTLKARLRGARTLQLLPPNFQGVASSDSKISWKRVPARHLNPVQSLGWNFCTFLYFGELFGGSARLWAVQLAYLDVSDDADELSYLHPTLSEIDGSYVSEGRYDHWINNLSRARRDFWDKFDLMIATARDGLNEGPLLDNNWLNGDEGPGLGDLAKWVRTRFSFCGMAAPLIDCPIQIRVRLWKQLAKIESKMRLTVHNEDLEEIINNYSADPVFQNLVPDLQDMGLLRDWNRE